MKLVALRDVHRAPHRYHIRPSGWGVFKGLLRSLLVLVCGSAAHAGDAAHGRVLFALAGGCGCTPDSGPVGSGGREIKTPFGTFYSPNITADRDTGVGGWSDEELTATSCQAVGSKRRDTP